MGLTRFVESFSVSLSESTPATFHARVIPLKEGMETLTEDVKGNQFKCIAAYRVPVSRYDWKNLNGRIYSKSLWENIIKSQKHIWEGGDGLADHPENDGSVKDGFCVWHNLGFSESSPGIVEADAYLYGHWGEEAQKKLEAGGKLGFSSSGFGELMEDGSTVNPDSYMLERVSDWVLNPSQNVFGDINMKKESVETQDLKESKWMASFRDEETEEDVQISFSADSKEEAQKKANKYMSIHRSQDLNLMRLAQVKVKENTSPQRKTEGVEIKETNTMTEKVDIVKKLSKSEEKRFRRDVEEFLTEALALSNPSKRLNELEEILSYFDETAGDFSDLKDRVTENIKTTQSEIDAAIQEHVNLKETFETEKVEDLKEGISKIATDAQFLEKQARDWKKIAEGLQGKLKDALTELNRRPQKNDVLIEKAKSHKARKLFEKKIELLQNMVETLKNSEKKSKALEERTLKELSNLQAVIESAKKTVALKNEVISAYKEEFEKLSERTEKAESYISRVEEAKKNVIREKPLTAPKDMFYGYRETNEVANYYKDLEARHGKAIVPYKGKILSCKTFFEASKLYTSILSEMDSHVSPISGGLERSERKTLIESSTGRKIITKAPMRLPETWD